MLAWVVALGELAFAVSALSISTAKSHLTEPLRAKLRASRFTLLSQLFECPFCLSVWFSLALSFGLPSQGAYWNFVDVFAVVGASSVISGVAIKLLHLGQHEFEAAINEVAELQVERDYYRSKLEELAQPKD